MALADESTPWIAGKESAVEAVELSVWRRCRRFAGCFFSIALVLATVGCRLQGERWSCDVVAFTNNIVEVYWTGEHSIDSSDFLHRILGHNQSTAVTRRSFLLSQIDLENQVIKERFVSGNEFTNGVTHRKNCIKEFAPARLSEDMMVIDAECIAGHILLQNRSASQSIVVSPTSTNVMEELRPYTYGRGAVNEKGDCLFFPFNSGGEREHLGMTQFALYRNGSWWISSISGKLPELNDEGFARTSSVPALIKVR